MKRRDFVGRMGGWAVGLLGGARVTGIPPLIHPSAHPPIGPSLLIPMDDSQSDHLKAYGLTYRVIGAGLKAEWLLNYQGGAFLLPDADSIRRDAALSGVRADPVDGGRVTAIRGEI